MAINVLIGSRIYLLAEGISKLLENADDIRLLGIISSDRWFWEMQKFEPDVVIADQFIGKSILENSLGKTTLKLLLIHDQPTLTASFGDLSTLITKGLAGVLANNVDGLMLRKAIGAVAKGELWLDHKTICTTICQQNSRKHDVQLTLKESEVLHYLCAGLSNKEIGEKLFVSEQTIKKHCNHLYKKFGVSNRVKLILEVSQITNTSTALPNE